MKELVHTRHSSLIIYFHRCSGEQARDAKDAAAQAENDRSALVTLWDNNRIDIFMQPSNARSC